MTRRVFAAATLLLSCLPLPTVAAQAKCGTPEPASDIKFSPGQVWSYRTRPQEPNSTVTILRVQKTPKLGTIVHIRIDGMHWKSCRGGASPTSMQHAPFTRAALEQSVKEQTGKVTTLPDFAAGYQDWLSHCGGAYTIPVAEVIAINDARFSAAQGCQ